MRQGTQAAVGAVVEQAVPANPTVMWLLAVLALSFAGLLAFVVKAVMTDFKETQKEQVKAVTDGFNGIKSEVRDGFTQTAIKLDAMFGGGSRKAGALLLGLLLPLAGCISSEESGAGLELASMTQRSVMQGELDRNAMLDSYHDEARRLSEVAVTRTIERDLAMATLGDAASRPTFSIIDVQAALNALNTERRTNETEFEAVRDKWRARKPLDRALEASAGLERWLRSKQQDAKAAETIKEAVK